VFTREALRLAALLRRPDRRRGGRAGDAGLIAAARAPVSAIDFSERMVGEPGPAAAAGLEGAIDIRVATAKALPFESAAYDAAFLDVRP
jgi:hypothetical protein